MSGFCGNHLAARFNSEQIERLGRDGKIPKGLDIVFDLAAYGNMAGHQGKPQEIYKANLMRVIDEMDYLGNAKYIYISTSSVILPVQTPYSASKKAAEEFLKIQDKRIAIVRPFTIVGIGDQKEHLIPKLIDSCLSGIEIPFVPEPVHDFLDVEDFVDALLVIKDRAQFNGEIYEVGSGKQISNDEVRLLIEQETGGKANINIVERMRAYDTKIWQANLERISTLGWKPKKDLRQSIKEMVNNYENNHYNIDLFDRQR